MSDVVYAIEKLHQWRRDADHMLVEHWKEMSSFPDVPLDPDWAWCEDIEAANKLLIYTARLRGELVGYATFIGLQPHRHYRSLICAFNDLVWVSPDHRGHGIAKGLFNFFENDLKQRGINVIQMRTKTKHPQLAMMLEARGYTSDEAEYVRRL